MDANIYYFTVFFRSFFPNWKPFQSLPFFVVFVRRMDSQALPFSAVPCQWWMWGFLDADILSRRVSKIPREQIQQKPKINTIIHKHFGGTIQQFSQHLVKLHRLLIFEWWKFQEKNPCLKELFHCSPYHLRHRHLWTRRTHHLWLQWVLVPLEMICLTQQTGETKHHHPGKLMNRYNKLRVFTRVPPLNNGLFGVSLLNFRVVMDIDGCVNSHSHGKPPWIPCK